MCFSSYVGSASWDKLSLISIGKVDRYPFRRIRVDSKPYSIEKPSILVNKQQVNDCPAVTLFMSLVTARSSRLCVHLSVSVCMLIFVPHHGCVCGRTTAGRPEPLVAD